MSTTLGAGLRAALTDLIDAIERVPCRRPLSESQMAVAALLSAGHSHADIAQRLGCERSTVRSAIEEGAARIPGNLPASSRLIAWYRGATRDVLGPDRDSA